VKKQPAKKTVKTESGTPVTSLPNIGKDTAAKLEKIGIVTAEDFLARDP